MQTQTINLLCSCSKVLDYAHAPSVMQRVGIFSAAARRFTPVTTWARYGAIAATFASTATEQATAASSAKDMSKFYYVRPGIVHPELAKLARKHEGSAKFFSFMDALSRDPAVGKLNLNGDIPRGGVFATKAHHYLYEKLDEQAQSLSLESFRGFGDSASLTLVGPRGIGKSTGLQAFQATANILYPSVIPIYISYIPLASTSSAELEAQASNEVEYLRTTPLAGIVADVLRAHKLHLDRGADMNSIITALETADRYVFLMVDELDKLYECAPTPEHTQTLRDLAVIGDSRVGRITAFLCGSSATLPSLVAAQHKDSPRHVAVHPLLAVAPNLNGQKYRTWRLPYSVPTEVNAVASITGITTPLAQVDVPCVRDLAHLVCFTAGSTSRNVARLVTKAKAPTEIDLQSLLVDESGQAEKSLTSVSDAAAFWPALMREMYRTNDPLFQNLRGSTGGAGVNLAAVYAGDWVHEFRPLPWSDAEAVFAKTVGASNPERMRIATDYLNDRDYITYSDGFVKGRTCAIYPYTLLQLLVHDMAPEGRGPILVALAEGFAKKRAELEKQVQAIKKKAVADGPHAEPLLHAAAKAAVEEAARVLVQTTFGLAMGPGSVKQMIEFVMSSLGYGKK